LIDSDIQLFFSFVGALLTRFFLGFVEVSGANFALLRY